MDSRILDLDGSIPLQTELMKHYRPTIIPSQEWGPYVRLACSFGRFRRFERHLADMLGRERESSGTVTFCGSGDFHHVSLALIRRLNTPINLLVLDNHPDWMRGVPFLHCGTWLYHAARLPHVEHVFHVGGNVDFDNYYQSMAPWRLLRSGKIQVFPSLRRFQRGAWSAIALEPLRLPGESTVRADRVEKLLLPFEQHLARRPLYVSLDKDVMVANDAVVNWDPGHLSLADLQLVLSGFLRLAGGHLAGMDIVGDWSPVHLRGWLRHLMHWTEHPAFSVDSGYATRRNEHTNLELLSSIEEAIALPASATLARRAAS